VLVESMVKTTGIVEHASVGKIGTRGAGERAGVGDIAVVQTCTRNQTQTHPWVDIQTIAAGKL
jgi:hypothetical protein